MPINPDFMSVAESGDFEKSIPTPNGEFFFVEDGKFKVAPMVVIYEKVTSGIKGNATQSNAPTTYSTETHPDGLTETYRAVEPLNNTSAWYTLADATNKAKFPITLDMLKANDVLLTATNGVISVFLNVKPVADPAKLPIYNSANSYAAESQFIDVGIIYRVKTGQTLAVGELPANFEGSKVEVVVSNVLVKIMGKNKLNPTNFNYTKYYSPGSKTLPNNTTNPYVLSGFVPVEEGKWYVVSRDNGTTIEQTGGYFTTDNIAGTAVSNITWVTPVNSNGKAFLVPIGSGINFVNFNITATSTAHTATNGNYQLEEGEMASAYEAFGYTNKINPDYLPEEVEVDSTLLEKYTDLSGIEIHPEISKISNFRSHYSVQDKDVVVANTGTSLTARTDEHCTLRTDASYRPPLMHSNNYASFIWDAMKWRGQEYRRYDAKTVNGGATNMFTEAGTGWTTATNHANWDDGIYRAGYTRYADDVAATIAFQIPIKAWQFNFIFRSETAGTENAVVTIAEGNGKVQVWNGSAWVEANGYIFSQKQAVQTLPTVTIRDAANGFDYTRTNYQIGGNTTYQKRLKMRVIDKAIVKNVTISRTSGRLLYWGVEWSEREFMLTFINAARGSHSIALVDNNLSLARFQENEIWSFKPDLILTENGIHNSGASKEPTTTYPTTYWGQATEDFFFSTTNSVSLKARATANGLTPEWVIFTSSIAVQFNGIDANGKLIFGTDKNGKVYTALDSFTKAHQHLLTNHPEVISINSAKYWVDAGFAVHGDLKTATTGSGKSGLTFTNEGGHWNDTGSKIIARTILPVLKF